MERKQLNVVAILGGTGGFGFINSTKTYFNPDHFTAVDNVTDSGGNSRTLRDELGVLPPGDSRRMMVAFAANKIQPKMAEIFNYELPSHLTTNGRLAGDKLGNLMISIREAALRQNGGSHDQALADWMEIMHIPGRILSVSYEPDTLIAELESGRIVREETKIDLRFKEDDFDPQDHIQKIYLEKGVTVNPDLLLKLEEADLFIISFGDLYTSTLPSVLVKGFLDALKRNPKVKTILCTNIMTKKGETDGFNLENYTSEVEKYLDGLPIDGVIAHNGYLPRKMREFYAKYGQEMILPEGDFQKQWPQTCFEICDLAHWLPEMNLVRHSRLKFRKALDRLLHRLEVI
jgi:uncharacterized cofD-like protein